MNNIQVIMQAFPFPVLREFFTLTAAEAFVKAQEFSVDLVHHDVTIAVYDVIRGYRRIHTIEEE